jgi:hypothetical protein
LYLILSRTVPTYYYVLIHQYSVSDPAPELEEKRESPKEKTGSELYMGSKEWLKVMTV